MDQFKHLSPKFKEVAAQSNENRIEFLKQKRWISYPVANRVLDVFAETLNHPKQARMPSILFIGESNNGKTSMIERFSHLHGQSYTCEETELLIKPVVAIELSGPNMRDLYYTILQEFWAPITPNETLAMLRRTAIDQMMQSKTKLLIIDEFHTLMNGTARARSEILAEIKRISNKLRIPVIASGVPNAANVIREDAQIQSRFSIVRLPLWEKGKDFISLLKTFETMLPLRKPSNLASREIGEKILNISKGNLGNIHGLLQVCAIEAINNGTEQIDKSIVESFSWYTPTEGPREIQL
ncbi:hypothetical protein SAMN06297229_0262 [Pseudidiomarina planktonica]|uniref:TniB protein n=1 Tax=Pseudidiomarina planktonica TaxID=1323738 RepID=A0A1Y6EA04_9GAMM|nr:TniB family NTP-binding protein [Pseudidiomarina planktonica]RUO66246.1 transposase [Pseudidiomarina planktonica]SMQ59414.1 hypothetical protein SAMN06297229_0262 [Pseudidiomarina planktonica]